MDRVTQEVHCITDNQECGYVLVKLNTRLTKPASIICPKCGNKINRQINNGLINNGLINNDQLNDCKNDMEEIVPTIAAWHEKSVFDAFTADPKINLRNFQSAFVVKISNHNTRFGPNFRIIAPARGIYHNGRLSRIKSSFSINSTQDVCIVRVTEEINRFPRLHAILDYFMLPYNRTYKCVITDIFHIPEKTTNMSIRGLLGVPL